jgi:hypothetical protein
MQPFTHRTVDIPLQVRQFPQPLITKTGSKIVYLLGHTRYHPQSYNLQPQANHNPPPPGAYGVRIPQI